MQRTPMDPVVEKSALTEGQAFVLRLLQQMEARREYGGIELKIEAGHVVLVRKIETRKFSGRNERGVHEHQER
jgi:hypothetical protein